MVTLVEVILRNKPRPEQGIRACVGILKLKRGSGPERLDAACARALALNACSLKSVTSILKNRLEDQPIEVAPDAPRSPTPICVVQNISTEPKETPNAHTSHP